MRWLSISTRSVAPLCGIMLGLVVLANTGSLAALEASDVVGGLWYVVSEGSSCGGNTSLYCPNGGSYGYSHCLGSQPFDGVLPGTGGRVDVLDEWAGCSSNPLFPLESQYCLGVNESRCI